MLKRRAFVYLLLGCYAPRSLSHSPWGQYQVYRQKHLLVLSTRDDPASYPYSKELVEALNSSVPAANARPARAIDLERVYNLLRTDQFQFAILSRSKVAMLRAANGMFEGSQKVDLRTIYLFNDLEFVVRADFPENLVAIVTHGILDSLAILPGAASIDQIKHNPHLHPGARKALHETLQS